MRLIALLLCLAAPAAGQELRGPALAAASNFGQGAQPDMMAAAEAHGIRDFRDAVYWDRVEDGAGNFTFTAPEETYPDQLAAFGAGMSLTVNNGHPAYDGGATPHTEAAVAAFGRHAAEMVRRFPAIHSVEVGNEVNAQNFVSGPVRDADLPDRAAYLLALLQSVHAAVKATNPEIRILGGGVHSLPGGYLEHLFALGAADYMDALAFHPYTTPPEQLARQIGVLRRIPGLATLPFEATEFGDTNPATAPATFLKFYCQMALSGVSRAVWYALNDRGDGQAPLIDRSGQVTAVGRAFAYAAAELAGKPVADVAPDPFTYACRFGADRMVIWGEPRAVTLGPEIRALDPTGAPVTTPRLSPETPLILEGPGLSRGETVQLAPLPLLADSYHQFAYPGGPTPDGFVRFARAGARIIPLDTLPGQERPGTLWTPYRGSARDFGLRLTAEILLPSGNSEAPVEVVHQYTADRRKSVTFEARLAPLPRSEDGVRATLSVNGVLRSDSLTDGEMKLAYDLDLTTGDTVELAVGPNGTATGDITAYRIRVLERQ